MREKLKKLKLKHSMMLGVVSNLFFIFFVVFCLLYYDLHGNTGIAVMSFEITAIIIEIIAFLIMSASIIMITLMVQQRTVLKIAMAVYLLVEVLVMLADFDLIQLGSWFDSYGTVIIIAHSIFSALICLLYLSLDKNKTPLQIDVIIAATLMLLGMFAVVFQRRIYISVLANTFGYLFLYVAVMVQIDYEILEIDCYGYKARVAEYHSSFFEH
ncbi:MAG: hypothetical protein LBR54_00275 [Oscillospiraceae bacterium]|jgi:hypothetical protein|nr:hypothetical protein [Oscillospiraceae bacterium]